MWLLTATAIAVVGGCIGFHEDGCMEEAHRNQVCKDKYNQIGAPDKVGLDAFCGGVVDTIKCLKDEFEACSNSQDNIEFIAHAVQYTEEYCNPDSEIYHLVSSNLECIMSHTREITECNPNAFAEILGIDGDDDSDRSNLTLKCQVSLVYVICQTLVMLDKCEEVGRVSLDILMNVTLHLIDCPKETVAKLPNLLPEIQLAHRLARLNETEIKKKK